LEDARNFVEDRTHDGRKYRMLNLIDEFTRECLGIRIDRKLNSTDVIDVLSDQFILRGIPGHIRSDHGPEFIARAVREWIVAVGARTAFIEPGSPWENGYCESFNSKLRDELLQGEIFYSLAEGDRHRSLASALQHPTTALIAGLSPTSPRGRAVAGSANWISCAGHPSRGAETRHELRNEPDHSMGAGQVCGSRPQSLILGCARDAHSLCLDQGRWRESSAAADADLARPRIRQLGRS
jgi:hypothetical protein